MNKGSYCHWVMCHCDARSAAARSVQSHCRCSMIPVQNAASYGCLTAHPKLLAGGFLLGAVDRADLHLAFHCRCKPVVVRRQILHHNTVTGLASCGPLASRLLAGDLRFGNARADPYACSGMQGCGYNVPAMQQSAAHLAVAAPGRIELDHPRLIAVRHLQAHTRLGSDQNEARCARWTPVCSLHVIHSHSPQPSGPGKVALAHESPRL